MIPALRGQFAVAIILFALANSPVCAGEVRAAVASDFAAPMERIVALFQQESGHTVTSSFDASGKLYSRIAGGAQFDVFLSADEAIPKRLMLDGKAVGGSRFVYAVGRLALWSTQPGLVDTRGSVLIRGNFNRLAIANPRFSPYGTAAKETLIKLTLWDAIQEKLDKGENVTQTYQLAATENDDLALIALSQVMRDGKVTAGSWWLVPPELHKTLQQSAVLLTGAKDEVAARAFLAFLKGEKAKEIIRGFGYELP